MMTLSSSRKREPGLTSHRVEERGLARAKVMSATSDYNPSSLREEPVAGKFETPMQSTTWTLIASIA